MVTILAKQRSSILADLFRYLDEERADYCVLGDVRRMLAGAAESRSIACVVLPETLLRIPLLLQKFCLPRRLLLVHVHATHDDVHAILSWVTAERRPAFVEVHFESAGAAAGMTLFTAESLLRSRIPLTLGPNNPSVCFAAPPAREFILTFLRAVADGVLEESQTSHLCEQWARDPRNALREVQRFWSLESESGVIARAAVSGDWQPVHAALPQLQRRLKMQAQRSWRQWLQARINGYRRWRFPQGLLVACLGPDGSGKASVMDALSTHPLAPFSAADTMHLRPGLFRRSGTRLKPRSVIERPRGAWSTLVKLLMFAADYWVGYWVRLRPQLVRSTLLISHRYYDDMLIDPVRYRMAGRKLLARLLLPLIPRPDLWLVFDVPGETLLQRNQDVSAAEARRQRGAYRRALRRHENFVMLDARRPLAEVTAQAECAIVGELARRTAERLRLPQTEVRNRTATKVLLFFCRHNVPVLSKVVRVLFNSDIYCVVPEDVRMPHPYGVVIHSQAVVGRRVTIMQQVTIGSKNRAESVAPIIGNDVYIGAGARIMGDVRIGDGAVIGANAVVTRDIPAGATVVGSDRIVGAIRIVGPEARPDADVRQRVSRETSMR